MMAVGLSIGLLALLAVYYLQRYWQAQKEYAVLVKQAEKRILIQETDEYGVISVVEDNGFRYLQFGNDVEQSCVLYDNPVVAQV